MKSENSFYRITPNKRKTDLLGKTHETLEWHRRLGYPSFENLAKLSNMASETYLKPKIRNSKSLVVSKTKLPFKEERKEPETLLEIIHLLTLRIKTRALVFESGMDCSISNRSPTVTTDALPDEKWFRKKHFKFLDAQHMASNYDFPKKLDPRSTKYRFVGYAVKRRKKENY
ncbi:hypothetical protein JTB14_026370 [Gonioctena quinquepunctata]|nr:hypothetical protein JTB14_026370 [Gonioctena quinquepunctata]